MQRLGGWARIGIVLSVLWSAYAFSYTASSIHQSVMDAGNLAFDQCLRRQDHDLKIDCWDAFHDTWVERDKTYKDNWRISTTWLALGVLPIPNTLRFLNVCLLAL
jgi:hypothetical protein